MPAPQSSPSPQSPPAAAQDRAAKFAAGVAFLADRIQAALKVAEAAPAGAVIPPESAVWIVIAACKGEPKAITAQINAGTSHDLVNTATRIFFSKSDKVISEAGWGSAALTALHRRAYKLMPQGGAVDLTNFRRV